MRLIAQNSHAIELRHVSESTDNAEANANIKMTRRYVKIRSNFFLSTSNRRASVRTSLAASLPQVKIRSKLIKK